MQTWIHFLLASFLFTPSAHAFDVGYNEAWFGEKYQTGLTSDFDLAQVNQTFRDLKSAGGDIVRLWIFQGRQGLVLNQHAPRTASVQPELIRNLKKIIASAKSHQLKIYFTLLDGNSMPKENSENRDYHYNLLNNKYGENDAYLRNAVAPVLALLNAHKDVIYGLDIMNEIQAPMINSYWGFSFDNWSGPRRWMKSTVQFIKKKSPWLQVTASSGWGWGAKNLRDGLFSDLGLDFYDVHVYDDDGTIPYAYDICERARFEKIKVILGEFGQKTKTRDDRLQQSSTEKFIKNAKASCFSGALAWRFDASEETWAFQNKDGSFRPAVTVMKAISR